MRRTFQRALGSFEVGNAGEGSEEEEADEDDEAALLNRSKLGMGQQALYRLHPRSGYKHVTYQAGSKMRPLIDAHVAEHEQARKRVAVPSRGMSTSAVQVAVRAAQAPLASPPGSDSAAQLSSMRPRALSQSPGGEPQASSTGAGA